METNTHHLRDVTCPFCGLACDDLTLNHSGAGLEVAKNGCAISTAAFRDLAMYGPAQARPRVAGKASTLQHALSTAAQILRRANAPLIAGLGTDVAGARAALELADRIGAVVDHMNMPAKLRNLVTLQNGGWITTTLAEVKNRADFVLVIGSGVVTRFPRFLQRVVWPKGSMFVGNAYKRKVFFLGEFSSLNSDVPNHVKRLYCRHDALPRIVPALRALINGQRLDDNRLAARDVNILQEIVAAMAQATYGVIAWAAPDFDFPSGELTIQTLAELIKDLNKTIRFAGLPLGGSDGDFSSNGVQTWQTGFPLRTRYGKKGLDYDPYRYGAAELLAAGEVDALLWISSFNAARLPPTAALPRIVLGPPSMKLADEPDVFIPVGTPGLHHGGHFIRADKVVVMRLAKLLENELPSVADAVDQIRRGIGQGNGG